MLKRLLKNSAWGTLGTGMGRILNLLAMILLARSLSLTDFGYFGLVQATLGVFAIFAGAGLGVTATRFLAEYRHTDLPRAGRILGLVWSTAFITVGITLLIVLTVSGKVAAAVAGEGEVGKVTIALAVGGVYFALQTARTIQESILIGLEHFREAAVLKFAEGASILLLLPLMAAWQGLVGAFTGLILAALLVLALGHGLAWRATQRAGITPDWSGMRREWPVLRSFSLPSLMSGMSAAPVLWLGVWLLSRQPDGIAQIALYNAAYQWHGPLVFMSMMLGAASIPILVQAWAEGDLRQFRRTLVLVSGMAVGCGLVPALGLILLREPIMRAYGTEYLAGQGVLILLLLAAPLHAAAKVGESTLQCMRHAWVVMGTDVVWGATFLAVTFLVVSERGALGLAAALATSYLVLALCRGGYIWLALIARARHGKP